MGAGVEGSRRLPTAQDRRGRFGGVAEWLGKGLQNPVHRFNSGPRLEAGSRLRFPSHARALSSVGERFPDTEEVRGSNPLAPTTKPAGQRRFTRPLPEGRVQPARRSAPPSTPPRLRSSSRSTPWSWRGLHELEVRVIGYVGFGAPGRDRGGRQLHGHEGWGVSFGLALGEELPEERGFPCGACAPPLLRVLGGGS